MLKLEYDKLTIYEVEELYQIFLESYDADQELTLDLENIQKIDMSAIQLLISTQNSYKEKGLSFSLHNLSDGLVETLKLSGCDCVLEVVND
ncbi:MAG: STAS domain-containing protein [Campylobacterota bacterium]|nr:STAS domain-containing protein [Campylobacterota bacterium]